MFTVFFYNSLNILVIAILSAKHWGHLIYRQVFFLNIDHILFVSLLSPNDFSVYLLKFLKTGSYYVTHDPPTSASQVLGL
jgi:hypothetical protein